MRYVSASFFVLFFLSCTYQGEEWREAWGKHEKDFKTVVDLMNLQKLKVLSDRISYVIPDSIALKFPCDQKVLKLDDQNKEESNSYLFFLDTAQRAFRKNPVLVYTTNKMRQRFYEKEFKDNVVKIESNWYFLYN